MYSLMNSLKKSIVLSLIPILFTGCFTYHGVLGADRGFGDAVKIESDIVISNLRIRYVVREKTGFCSSGRIHHIELDGPIGPDSSEVIERLLKRIPKCEVIGSNGKKYSLGPFVYLNSAGGLLADGYKLANTFRKYDVATALMGKQVCASACAIAFLGGQGRLMQNESKLVFHAPYTMDRFLGSINCATKAESEKLKDYYINLIGRQNGEFLFARTMDYCSSSEGWVINKDAAKMFNITNM